MSEKKYELLLDTEEFNSKPVVPQIKLINNRITDHEVNLTQEEIAEEVGNKGRTMVLATMNGSRSKKNMVKQEVVALDFDNTVIVDGKKMRATGEDYSSVADIFNDPFIQENASFLYSTFSHTDDWHKFRVVFFLDRPITTNEQVEIVYTWLMDKYPTADKSAKDSSRLFFGGTEMIEVGFGNEINTAHVHVDKSKVNKNTPPPKSYATAEKISNEDAIELFESYLEEDKENLQDYNNALSVIWVLARSAKTKEISPVLAQDFVQRLAFGNSEWEEENQKKFEEAMNTPLHDFYTDYTFAQKFGYHQEHAKPRTDDPISMSKFLVEELDIKLFNHALYFKTENHWINDKNKMLRAIDHYFENKSTLDEELIKQFMKRAELIEIDDNRAFPVQFRNNHYLLNGEIHKGTTEDFTPFYLDVDYEPEVYDEHVDNFLDFLTMDRCDLRTVIEEMIAHILMVKDFPHKVFFFIGSKGANGKSTFLEMLNSFSGELGTNISLEDFNDATSVVELEGKLVNIGDDIDASYLESSSNFKILASGNTLMVRPIYSTPYRMKNRATLIFTANDMPSFKDKTGGIQRRLVIIPCDNVVTEADFSIDEKLSSDNAKSYLLNLALEGLKRIRDNGGQLSDSETINENIKEYLAETNNILAFISQVGINEDLPDRDVYKDYKDFCKEFGFTPYTKTNFTQELKRNGYEQKRQMRLGKRQNYYIKVD